MELNDMNFLSLLLIVLALTTTKMAEASDPDILSDFIVPPYSNYNSIDGNFFTYQGAMNPPHSSICRAVVPRCWILGFGVCRHQECALYPETANWRHVHLPKGLVHYHYNSNNEAAAAVSAFGSASAIVSVPKTVFGTGIDDGILAQAFKSMWLQLRRISPAS
ncbi:hypothetical protein Tsubulata_030733 [Turnera subulata]|uniref:Cupin type-1 domain-containing protein n=1 Tax=Turnera subulata TaxID=218843 RepID=A0A9Q0FUI3_9ROSI|nr:hypothetical protein Tsubulata_030733 [Turnera subulata]